MPELPEVEIARENLERWLVGRRVLRASAPDALLRGGQNRREVEGALTGARVRAVRRWGKFLVIDLGARRPSVVAHLGMTGRFLRLGSGEALPRFVRVELALASGVRVVLDDARRLGQFRLLDEAESRRLEALGPDPLGPELTPSELLRRTGRSSMPIKPFLMDQQKVAGIGNIQAAEALFLARIHPARPARALGREDAVRLVRSLRKALTREIERHRTEAPVYYQQGSEHHFLVYGRRGEPCPRCGTPIARFLQGGRSSYYCPSCQPETA